MFAVSDKKILWLIYTVLLGMVPIFMRLIVANLVNGERIPVVAASDFISLGIVIHISVLAEIRYSDTHGATWKQAVTGVTVLALIFYSVLYAASVFSEVSNEVNTSGILWSSMFMAVVSFLVSLVVYDRLAYAPEAPVEVAND
ncbi:hypothetical protein RRX38_08785 [Pseudomonas sp. DTU_2021_1001937_2_SI_NGA_ILE_001]|uniref:hypothetical protein n=1 Tax=Pseudomonas sp. DTU_2021_1001937_2_SI_NGA_ILE_001 TaxID=3077589 RepID=UPI0028FC2422|nr:hypothetical protein [Pseudomonas sp. DTU_2021_1001937_2_SI_NGA_ILE_001]WNW11245.1 hypothetical protein RRX38_08785 [Pseudomonas sp. DTU_2021_1001937_2_SI_NGA_ILE_001]